MGEYIYWGGGGAGSQAETSLSRPAHLQAALGPPLCSEVEAESYKPTLPPALPAICAEGRPGLPCKLRGSTWHQVPGKLPSQGSLEGEQISTQLLSVHSNVKSCLVLNSEHKFRLNSEH